MPTYANDYIHRIGRTGRAGKDGSAVSFMDVNERKFLKSIEDLLKTSIKQKVEEGFEPTAKISNERSSRNLRGKRTGRFKGEQIKKTKDGQKKSFGQAKQVAKKNKKKKSKARSRWKKVK
jgi:ATP-dependent RNA helicase RhlE